jgi:hypothetical protein
VTEYSYHVVPNDDGWAIAYKGRRAGAFPTRDDAVDEAVRLAREARGCGYDVEVLVSETEDARPALAYAERGPSGRPDARH